VDGPAAIGGGAALEAAVVSGGVPGYSLALHGRWWQLETVFQPVNRHDQLAGSRLTDKAASSSR